MTDEEPPLMCGVRWTGSALLVALPGVIRLGFHTEPDYISWWCWMTNSGGMFPGPEFLYRRAR